MIYENGFYDIEVAQEARLFDFDDDADFSVKRSPQPKSRRFVATGSTLFSSPTGGFSIPYTKTGGVHARSMPVLIPSSVDNLKNIIQNNNNNNNSDSSNSISNSLTMRQAVEVETPLSGDCGSPDWCSERALLTLDDLQSRQLHNNRHNQQQQQQQQHYHHHHHHHYHQTRQSGNLSVSTADSMLTLEELKDHFSSCFTCGVSWNEEHVSLDCFECGGYSMERPCPICDGKCNRTWRRDITMTHALRKAHWEGECGLVLSQDRDAIFLKNLVDATEESISKALKDLNASS